MKSLLERLAQEVRRNAQLAAAEEAAGARARAAAAERQKPPAPVLTTKKKCPGCERPYDGKAVCRYCKKDFGCESCQNDADDENRGDFCDNCSKFCCFACPHLDSKAMRVREGKIGTHESGNLHCNECGLSMCHDCADFEMTQFADPFADPFSRDCFRCADCSAKCGCEEPSERQEGCVECCTVLCSSCALECEYCGETWCSVCGDADEGLRNSGRCESCRDSYRSGKSVKSVRCECGSHAEYDVSCTECDEAVCEECKVECLQCFEVYCSVDGAELSRLCTMCDKDEVCCANCANCAENIECNVCQVDIYLCHECDGGENERNRKNGFPHCAGCKEATCWDGVCSTECEQCHKVYCFGCKTTTDFDRVCDDCGVSETVCDPCAKRIPLVFECKICVSDITACTSCRRMSNFPKCNVCKEPVCDLICSFECLRCDKKCCTNCASKTQDDDFCVKCSRRAKR